MRRLLTAVALWLLASSADAQMSKEAPICSAYQCRSSDGQISIPSRAFLAQQCPDIADPASLLPASQRARILLTGLAGEGYLPHLMIHGLGAEPAVEYLASGWDSEACVPLPLPANTGATIMEAYARTGTLGMETLGAWTFNLLAQAEDGASAPAIVLIGAGNGITGPAGAVAIILPDGRMRVGAVNAIGGGDDFPAGLTVGSMPGNPGQVDLPDDHIFPGMQWNNGKGVIAQAPIAEPPRQITPYAEGLAFGQTFWDAQTGCFYGRSPRGNLRKIDPECTPDPTWTPTPTPTPVPG